MPQLQHVETLAPLVGNGAAFLFGGTGYQAAPKVSLWQNHAPSHPDTVSAHVSAQFLELLKAYRPSGGLLRAQEAAARCKPHSGTDVHTLAGWILGRKVVSFEWLSRIWLPLFQFNRFDMTRQSGLEAVLAELTTVYDDWEIANWFARPNVWLAGGLPSVSLANEASEVLEAARAERYVVAG